MIDPHAAIQNRLAAPKSGCSFISIIADFRRARTPVPRRRLDERAIVPRFVQLGRPDEYAGPLADVDSLIAQGDQDWVTAAMERTAVASVVTVCRAAQKALNQGLKRTSVGPGMLN